MSERLKSSSGSVVSKPTKRYLESRKQSLGIGNRYLDNGSENLSDEEDDYDVHEVVKTGTYLEVKEVIAKDRPRLIALKDELGRTVLHHAVSLDRTKIALFLISKNADVNARDNEEATPLHLAAANGLTEMCRFLLEFRANIRAKDSKCWTALHYAVDGNHMETATLLVKRNVDLHAEDHRFGRTALHLAAEKGFTEMAEMLIIRGANLSASGDAFYSKTPLHLACINGHAATVRMLCQRGADVNALSGLLDKTPLHFTVEKGYLEIVRILIEFGADANEMGKHTNGNTPLHLAAQYNYFNIADLLLRQKDIQINQQGKFTTLGTPLHIACQFGHIHLVRLLLDYGADLTFVDENGHSPLHIACLFQHYDLVTLLIESHANPTVLSLKKKTPIDYIQNPIVREEMHQLAQKIAQLRKEEEEEKQKQRRIQEHRQQLLAQQLILAKQKEFERNLYKEVRRNEFIKSLILICDKSGDLNALVKLSEEYSPEEVDINEPLILLSHLSNNPNFREFRLPEIQNKTSNQAVVSGMTLTANSGGTGGAMGHDWEMGSQSSLGSIGSGYSTIFTNNRTHATALTLATLRGYYELVQGLLQWPEININAQENNGNTALHNAALINSRDLCELLLLHGANNCMINHQGKTAANLTTKLSLQEVIRNPRLIATRQHLQNTVIQAIFEKKKKIAQNNPSLPEISPKNSTQDQNYILEGEEHRFASAIASYHHQNNSSVMGLKSLKSPSSSKNPDQKEFIQEKKEIALQDLLKEKEMLQMTQSLVMQAASSKALTQSLPIIASQFTTNILPQLHAKENPKIDLQSRSRGFNANNNDNTAVTALTLPAVPGASSATNGVASHPLLEQKYGPIPASFGGNRSDFFQVALYTSKVMRLQQQFVNSSSSTAPTTIPSEDLPIFADLFHLQKSYLPTAFDATNEWNQVKDLLWLVGYPYRRQMVKVVIPVVQQQQYYSSYHDAVHSLPQHPHSLPHSTHYHPQYPQERYLPHNSNAHYQQQPVMTMKEEMQEDKRSILYQIAKIMNDCQRSFTLSSEEIDFDVEVFFQQRYHPPLPSASTMPPETSSSVEDETNPTDTLHSTSPSLEASLIHFLQFNNYCIQRHLLDHLPRHIHNLEDYYKVLLFSNYCFALVTYLLCLLHQDSSSSIRSLLEEYLDWSREEYYHSHYLSHQEASASSASDPKAGGRGGDPSAAPPFYEFRLYLILKYEQEIYALPPSLGAVFGPSLLTLLRFAMLQSYESFLQYYNYHFPEQAHTLHHPSFQYSEMMSQQTTKERKKKKKNEQELEVEEEEEKEWMNPDPLKEFWADIIRNPPRSLRLIIDGIFEVTSQLPSWLERLFPQDVVRGQIWLLQATEMMTRLLEEEKQRLLLEESLRNQRQSLAQEEEEEGEEGDLEDLNDLPAKKTAISTSTIPQTSLSLPSSLQPPMTKYTPLQLWLSDLQLLEYESFFLINGFRVLEDFQELNQDDCYVYFPFLKVGDLRRLTKHILQLTDELVEYYQKKCLPG